MKIKNIASLLVFFSLGFWMCGICPYIGLYLLQALGLR